MLSCRDLAESQGVSERVSGMREPIANKYVAYLSGQSRERERLKYEDLVERLNQTPKFPGVRRQLRWFTRVVMS